MEDLDHVEEDAILKDFTVMLQAQFAANSVPFTQRNVAELITLVPRCAEYGSRKTWLDSNSYMHCMMGVQ